MSVAECGFRSRSLYLQAIIARWERRLATADPAAPRSVTWFPDSGPLWMRTPVFDSADTVNAAGVRPSSAIFAAHVHVQAPRHFRCAPLARRTAIEEPEEDPAAPPAPVTADRRRLRRPVDADVPEESVAADGQPAVPRSRRRRLPASDDEAAGSEILPNDPESPGEARSIVVS